MQLEFSPRAVLFGALAFVVITLLMLAAIEWIGVERIQKTIEDAGTLAPLAYIFLKAITYIFAPLSAGPIQLSSGLLFGLWSGVFYSLLGEVVGGSISFLIARKLGRPVVARFVGANSVTRVDQLIGELGGWRALAYARLFLFSVYDFVSYAAGLTTTITFRQYLLVSVILGFIPTFIFVAVGTSLTENRSLIIPLYIGVGAISIAPFVIRWLLRRKSPGKEG
jgi:uncharacterized membrane protein YdjX (TVP38/TMEM64 family)